MLWDVGIVFFQVLNLAALAGLGGGLFCLLLAQASGNAIRLHLLRYTLISAATGVLAVAAFFLVTIGAINQSGWQGMFDALLAEILLQTGLGSASKLRFAGFALGLAVLGPLAVAVTRKKAKPFALPLPLSVLSVLLLVSALLCLWASFAFTGHPATLGFVARFAIVLHIIGFTLWAGSLYPLWYLCRHENTEKLQSLMRRFGQLALGFVALLLLSGVYLLFELLSSPAELFTDTYGRYMLLKLFFVALLLGLATVNKFRLVPALNQHRGRNKLQASISLELLAVLLILVLVSVLTSVIGI